QITAILNTSAEELGKLENMADKINGVISVGKIHFVESNSKISGNESHGYEMNDLKNISKN
ncbi:hypothetical protein NPIL_541311, partial [Nephila pilipes]